MTVIIITILIRQDILRDLVWGLVWFWFGLCAKSILILSQVHKLFLHILCPRNDKAIYLNICRAKIVNKIAAAN